MSIKPIIHHKAHKLDHILKSASLFVKKLHDLSSTHHQQEDNSILSNPIKITKESEKPTGNDSSISLIHDQLNVENPNEISETIQEVPKTNYVHSTYENRHNVKVTDDRKIDDKIYFPSDSD